MPQTDLNLKDFMRGYIVCALWSSTGDDEEPLDDKYGPEDLSEEALHRMTEDCIDFIAAHAQLMLETNASADQHGHDFWLTRNGHGAGFWDRGYGDVGTKLSEACKPYGGCDLYEGDNGQLHIL